MSAYFPKCLMVFEKIIKRRAYTDDCNGLKCTIKLFRMTWHKVGQSPFLNRCIHIRDKCGVLGHLNTVSLPVAGSYTFSLLPFSWVDLLWLAQKFSGAVMSTDPEETYRAAAANGAAAGPRLNAPSVRRSILKLAS